MLWGRSVTWVSERSVSLWIWKVRNWTRKKCKSPNRGRVGVWLSKMLTNRSSPLTAPHVVYQTGKKPDEPCSITSSLNYFPEDEPGEANVTAPPKSPPSNLTVVTVEGCPSFVILDWEKTDNDTTGTTQ